MKKGTLLLGLGIGIFMSSCESAKENNSFSSYKNFISYTKSIIPFYLDQIEHPAYFSFHLTDKNLINKYIKESEDYCKAFDGQFIVKKDWFYCKSKNEFIIHHKKDGFEVFLNPHVQISIWLTEGKNAIESGEYEKAFHILNKALKFSSVVKDKNLVGQSYYYLALATFKSSSDYNIKTFFYYLNKANKNGQNVEDLINDSIAKAEKDLNTVINLVKTDQINKALNIIKRAEEIATETNNPSLLYSAYYYYGNLYLNTKDYDNAITYFNKALYTISKESTQSQKNNENVLYNLLGQAYELKGDIQNAQKYYLMASKAAQDANDTEGAAIPLRHLGDIYAKKKDYKDALIYHKKALDIRGYKTRKGGARYGLAPDLLNVGSDYYHLNDCSDAVKYLDEAIPYFDKLGIYDSEIIALKEDIDCYIKLNEKDKAKELYEKYKPLINQMNKQSEFKSFGF